VPNGRSGVATTMEVRLNDAFGHPVPGASGSIEVVITGRNPDATIDISDQGGGLYHVRYTPLASGDDSIVLRVGGAPIPGSPFRSVVEPGPVSPSHSTAAVSLQNNGFFVVITVIVTARDAQGNPVGRGGETVLVSVNDGDPVEAEDRGDGTYRTASLGFGSQFTVVVEMNGTPVQGSPFQLSR